MQIKLSHADREIAICARAILLRELEKASKLLQRCGLATMMVDAEMERVQAVNKELTKQSTLKEPNLATALCGCQVSALAVYWHDLDAFRKKQGKLSLDTGETVARQRVVKALGCRFGGQEDLFQEQTDEDEETTEKGKGKAKPAASDPELPLGAPVETPLTALVATIAKKKRGGGTKSESGKTIELPFMGGARMVPKLLGAGEAADPSTPAVDA